VPPVLSFVFDHQPSMSLKGCCFKGVNQGGAAFKSGYAALFSYKVKSAFINCTDA